MKLNYLILGLSTFLVTLSVVLFHSQSAQASSAGPGVVRLLVTVFFHPTTIGIILAVLAIIFWISTQKQNS